MFSRFLVAIQAVYRFFMSFVLFFSMPANFYNEAYTASNQMDARVYPISFANWQSSDYVNPLQNVYSKALSPVFYDIDDPSITLSTVLRAEGFTNYSYVQYISMLPVYTDAMQEWTGKSNEDVYSLMVLEINFTSTSSLPNGFPIGWFNYITIAPVNESPTVNSLGFDSTYATITNRVDLTFFSASVVQTYDGFNTPVSFVVNTLSGISWLSPNDEMYLYLIVLVSYLFVFWIIIKAIKNILS